MRTSRKTVSAEPPEQLRARIEEFVRACREPALLEPGERRIRLEPGQYDFQIQGSALVLHAWSVETSLVRRIVRIKDEQRGRLDLITRRLAQGEGGLLILDLAHAGAEFERQESRLEFRELFRRILAREFGGWQVAQVSAAADLEHSLSPACARAFLTRGQSGFAAIGIDSDAGAAACDHILSFGLIWLDYLRARETKRVVEGLKIFLPAGRAATTANRLAYLDTNRARYELYEIGEAGAVTAVGESNYGNLATSLHPAAPAPQPAGEVAGWIERLVTRFGAERVTTAEGIISLRLRGLEFARASARLMTYGVGENRPVTAANFQQVEDLAAQIRAARSVEAAGRQEFFYRAAPERWLETLVRADVSQVDSGLMPGPLYAQVPAVAGSDRGIIDLLACDRHGRLTVLELKASEDIHLPLQGLDYWMRVKWHLDRGEFQKRGYFPGVELQSLPPRLLLVSPVFDFHPTTQVILQYFSPQVEVHRVGLGAEWRSGLKVVFRAAGAERPG
jgi:hypothetical protein